MGKKILIIFVIMFFLQNVFSQKRLKNDFISAKHPKGFLFTEIKKNSFILYNTSSKKDAVFVYYGKKLKFDILALRNFIPNNLKNEDFVINKLEFIKQESMGIFGYKSERYKYESDIFSVMIIRYKDNISDKDFNSFLKKIKVRLKHFEKKQQVKKKRRKRLMKIFGF